MATSDDDEQVVGRGTAHWVQGAGEEQRDAHYRAQVWSHVLPLQIDRLYEARRQALESSLQGRNAGYYPDEARWPFMQMDAEAHFALLRHDSSYGPSGPLTETIDCPRDWLTRRCVMYATRWSIGTNLAGVQRRNACSKPAQTPPRTSGRPAGRACSVTSSRTRI